MQINPYLTMNGTALAALTFYADALGGKIEGVMRFSEIPDGTEIPPGQEDRLAHGRLEFAGGSLMISDDFEDKPITYSGFNIQTDWPTVAQAQQAFEKMAAGGTVIMPFEPTFWAAGFGMLRDKFGVSWMFNCESDG
ncbi:VOC family protein [Yoonia sp. SS1-5]|uniref:VOC family protein n=1 Tax=Yoonia rhodophyticola TaxID=3137370 RepID=A0AAN0MCR0_9RHOB